MEITRKILIKNTFQTFFGQGVPFVVAFFSVPIIIKGLGVDRFGVLMLMWSVIGYLSLFDFGLGRALTQQVAQLLGKDTTSKQEMTTLIGSSSGMLIILGIIGGILGAVSSHWIVHHFLKIPEFLLEETTFSLYILCFSMPVIFLSSGLRGILQGYQRFDLINAVQIPMGILMFLIPLAILPISKSLIFIIGTLFIFRIITLMFYFALVINITSIPIHTLTFKPDKVSTLFSFGGWMTISNVISPLLVYFDRFILGSMTTMQAVTFYTTPYEMITKLWIIPTSLANVLFPTFSTTHQSDPIRTQKLYLSGLKYVLLFLFPVILLTAGFAREGLSFWINPDFAVHSSRILQWLALGVFINSLAQIAINLVQGVGRPDLSAKLHFSELPIYLIALYLLILKYGAEGAAIAWVLRVTFDGTVLFIFANNLLPIDKLYFKKTLFLILLAIMAIITIPFIKSIPTRIIFLTFNMFLHLLYIWKFLLTYDEQVYISKYLTKR